MISVTKTPPGGLEDAIDDLNKALTKGQRDAVKDLAKIARKSILDETKARRGGTLSFSGMNAKLSLRTTTKAHPTSATTFLDAVPAGAWSIVEHGSQAHEITPKRGRRGRNGRRPALLVEGVTYAAEVYVLGARPRRVWDASCDEADKATGKTIEDAFDEAMENA